MSDNLGTTFQISVPTLSNLGESGVVAALEGGGFVATWQSYRPIGKWVGDVWIDGEYGLYARVFDAAGSPIGSVREVTSPGPHVSGPARVAALDDGGFMAVWTDQRGGPTISRDVYGRTFDAADGATSGTFRINASAEGYQYAPTVTALEGDAYLATWTSNVGPSVRESEVYGRLFDSAGNPVGSDFRLNQSTEGSQHDTSIAALDGGGFVATWSTSIQHPNDGWVFGRVFDAAGNPVGGEFRLHQSAEGVHFDTSIAALEGGGFVATWSNVSLGDGSYLGRFGRVFDESGSPLSGEFQLSTSGEGRVDHTSVAGLDGGGFVITWRVFTPHQVPADRETKIYAQAFDAAGSPVANAIQLDTSADGQHSSTSTVALDGGGFISSWTTSHLGEARVYGQVLSLFTAQQDTVDFNQLSAQQQKAVAIGLGVSDAAGGDDVVILPDAGEIALPDAGNASSFTWDPQQTFRGGKGDDTITGGALDDVIDGGEGDDTIVGGDGDDTVAGGEGDDNIQGIRPDKAEDGANAIDGGFGVDTVTYNGAASDYSYAFSAPSDSFGIVVTVRNEQGARDTIDGWERLEFADGSELTLATINKWGVWEWAVFSLDNAVQAAKEWIGKPGDPGFGPVLKIFDYGGQVLEVVAQTVTFGDDAYAAGKTAFVGITEKLTDPFIDEAADRLKEAADIYVPAEIRDEVKAAIDQGAVDLKTAVRIETGNLYDEIQGTLQPTVDNWAERYGEEYLKLVDRLFGAKDQEQRFGDGQPAFEAPEPLKPEFEVPAGPVLELEPGGDAGDGDNEQQPIIRLGGVGNDLINGGPAAGDILAGGAGSDTFAGTAAALDGDTILDFTDEDRLLVEGSSFTGGDMTVTYGSAILGIDTDGDGVVDTTITLLGDFQDGQFEVGPAGGGEVATEIRYTAEDEPSDGLVTGLFELPADTTDPGAGGVYTVDLVVTNASGGELRAWEVTVDVADDLAVVNGWSDDLNAPLGFTAEADGDAVFSTTEQGYQRPLVPGESVTLSMLVEGEGFAVDALTFDFASLDEPPVTAGDVAESLRLTLRHNDWGHGFVVEGEVLNGSAEELDDWTLQLTFPEDVDVTNAWGAELTDDVGSTLTFSAVDWNATVAPGASASFGFEGVAGGIDWTAVEHTFLVA